MKPIRWLLVAAALMASAPSARAWNDYQIIYWQQRNQAQLATLKRLGITAATVIANRDGSGTSMEQQIAPILATGLHWYIENIATDFYAAYHRWFPGKKVHWRFVEAQERFRQNPDDVTVFHRDPSFADPAWQHRIRERLVTIVHEQSRYRPLYYSLGDETGIADLSAFFDYDLSPGSLAGMREWLRQNYGSLAALNEEWGTSFNQWDDVRPETTRQAMRRTDDNFTSWADFKTWMDVAFARALRMGTDAVHSADLAALSAIEGVQAPGWGGYDYSLLVDAVDLLEVDDLPLAKSLNPKLITLTTAFAATPDRIHRIWRDLLAGSQGLVLWDSAGTIVRPDATLGERGQAYANTFAELRGGLASRLLAAERLSDPIAILYSPASFRTQWMLEHKPRGDAWMQRDSEAELGPNDARDAMWMYREAVTHLGLHPEYVSSAMLERGELRGARTLILPHAIALSPAEVRAIWDFAAGGGRLIADVQPGLFNAHSRRLPQAQIDLSMLHIVPPAELSVASLGVTPRVAIEAPNADVTTQLWRSGKSTLVAVQRDYAPAAAAETIVLLLPQSGDIYDLRNKRALGNTNRVELTLDTVAPAILSVTPAQ